jgi:hypothetical protein
VLGVAGHGGVHDAADALHVNTDEDFQKSSLILRNVLSSILMLQI